MDWTTLPDPDDPDFGTKLAKWQRETGCTGEQLGKALLSNRFQISRYRSPQAGQRQRPVGIMRERINMLRAGKGLSAVVQVARRQLEAKLAALPQTDRILA